MVFFTKDLKTAKKNSTVERSFNYYILKIYNSINLLIHTHIYGPKKLINHDY